MLEIGTAAPDFTVPDSVGNEVTLSDHKGHYTLLWWFPKADTPG